MAKRRKTMATETDAPRAPAAAPAAPAAPAAAAAAAVASPAASAAPGSARPRATDLQGLEASDASASQLLAILHELRSTVGQKVVDNAISTVMRDPEAYEKRLAQQRDASARKWQPPKKRQAREFRMDKYASRRVAVKFLYDGEKYAGFARQDHMDATVERFLFDALVRTRLIGDIDSCEYSRCGRTDRGVSAFGQVIALRVRSNVPAGATPLDVASIDEVRAGEPCRVRLASGEEATVTEIDYPTHLNRSLPPEIRVYSVVACAPAFNARFDCRGRVYRYFFVKRQLDVDRMRAAAQLLVGQHDFRNFCRIDTNCRSFEREISSFEVVPCEAFAARDDAHQTFRFEIRGRAFLWHQVRCMVQVLFLIGEGREEPEVISRLLDVVQTPRKPQYDMAADLPLVLHDCAFDADSVAFTYSPLALLQVRDQLSETWERHSIRAAIARSHLDEVERMAVRPADVVRELDHYSPRLEELMVARGMLARDVVEWAEVMPLLPLARKRKVLPLLERDTADSVAERQHKMTERKRRRAEGCVSHA